MITDDFEKKIEEMTDEDWKGAYELRMNAADAKGGFWNSFNDWSDYKRYVLSLHERSKSLISFVESDGRYEAKFPYHGIYRAWYPYKSRRNTMIIHCKENDDIIRMPVRMFNNPDPTQIKLNVVLEMSWDIETYDVLLDRVWDHIFPDAAMVAFVTPDNSKVCFIDRASISLDVKPTERPTLDMRGRVYFHIFAKRSEWYDLKDKNKWDGVYISYLDRKNYARGSERLPEIGHPNRIPPQAYVLEEDK